MALAFLNQKLRQGGLQFCLARTYKQGPKRPLRIGLKKSFSPN